jgi:predicted Zn-dependent protease
VSEALELAERALAAAGSPGEGVLTRVVRERSQTLRFARSSPTQATAVDDLTVELCAVRGGHTGSAWTNANATEALESCARAAVAAAEAAARAAGEGRYPGFPASLPARAHEGHDPETARLDPAVGGAALTAIFDAADRHAVEAHGVFTAGEIEHAVASSTGIALSERVTDAFVKAVCIAPSGRSGYAADTAVGIGGVAPAAVGERAAAKAAAGEPTTLEPGEHPVVMERHALGELLTLLAGTAFNGLAHTEGRGALSGLLGTRVAAPSVNLSDSPRYRGTLSRSFDAEGVPKAPIPLIQDGVAHAVVHDTRSAALAGAASTGHALAPGGDDDGPVPTNLVLVGGGAADEAELCAPVERGVYVTRLWYGNVVREREALVTAVTRDGTFLIEDGRVTRPIHDLRLTDGVLRILSGVEALGSRPLLTSDGELYGRRFATGHVCPPVRIAGVRFTSAAG